MYRTLKKAKGPFAHPTNVGCDCPICGARIIVGDQLDVVAKCPHFVRRWRVTADGRVRAEFRVGSPTLQPAGGA